MLRHCIVALQGRRYPARRPAALRSWMTATRKEERQEKAAGDEEVKEELSHSLTNPFHTCSLRR